MLKVMNCDALGKGIELFRDLLIPFETDFNEWARINRIEIQTEGQYFLLKNKNLCGFESDTSIISVINGKISKILYRFNNPALTSRVRLRAALFRLITDSMGRQDQVKVLSRDQKILLWQFKNAYVELNMNGNETDLILVSKKLKTHKKKGFFERIFRN